ncbi:MAG: hypothetical protein ACK5JE_07410 [Castellaniella sp.]|uniref:hypothetical protein n=1 Tax=Castellaniella sp. TaxID=1955812 RepID=UPI003A843235
MGILSAFAPELEPLRARLQDPRVHTIQGVEFTTGRLEGKPVARSLSVRMRGDDDESACIRR